MSHLRAVAFGESHKFGIACQRTHIFMQTSEKQSWVLKQVQSEYYLDCFTLKACLTFNLKVK